MGHLVGGIVLFSLSLSASVGDWSLKIAALIDYDLAYEHRIILSASHMPATSSTTCDSNSMPDTLVDVQ